MLLWLANVDFAGGDGSSDPPAADSGVHPDYYWARRTRHFKAYKSKAGPFVFLLMAIGEAMRAKL
jgi:hypothetical protein